MGYFIFGALMVHIVAMNTLMDGLPERPWAIALGSLVALWGLALMGLAVRFWGGYRHPIFRALGSEAATIVADVERELEHAQVFGEWDRRIYLSDHWLLSGGVLIRLSDILWFYPKTTRHSVNFIPTGTTRSVELFTTNRSGHNALPLTLNADDADALYAELLKRAPWAFEGFRPEWKTKWQSIAREVEAKVVAKQSDSYRA